MRLSRTLIVVLAGLPCPALASDDPFTCLATCPSAGEVIATSTSTSITIPPRESGSAAFITQIGDEETASIRQQSTTQFARITQGGRGDGASVTQMNEGAHYAQVDQAGAGQLLMLVQAGDGAQSAILSQTGENNTMSVAQAGVSSNDVMASQNGSGNDIAVAQTGGQNAARLTQFGNADRMNVVQNGFGNQLTWTQTGDNLAALQVTQNGNQALAIAQSR